MVERIKTVFLAFLVILSLLLTYKLWFGLPIYEETSLPSFERFYFGYPRPLSEVVQPREIVVFEEDRIYRFGPGEDVHSLLWESAFSFLSDRSAAISPLERKHPEGGKILLYRFSLPFPLEEYHEQFAEMHVSEVKLHLLDEESYILLTDIHGGHYIMEGIIDPHTMESLFDEIHKGKFTQYKLLQWPEEENSGDIVIEIEGEFYVPREKVKFGYLEVNQEQLDTEQLLKSFFVNNALVRRIEERDGSLIFTDGEQGLRFFTRGLEYSAPGVEKGSVNLSYTAALRKLSDFLNLHGGWPSCLYLTRSYLEGTGPLEGESFIVEGCVFYRGLPLLADQPALRVSLGDHGVSNYTRLVVIPGQEINRDRAMIPAEEAIKKAVEKYRDYIPGEKNVVITDVFLAYYLGKQGHKGYFSPVWVVELKNQFSFYIDACSGEIVNQAF